MLDKFERFNYRLSDWCEWVAFAGMLVVMAITCIDVVGAKVFGWRLMGALDIVVFAQVVAISFAAGMTLILGRHIKVEFVVKLLPRRTQAVIDSIILILLLGFFMVIIWRLIVLGHTFRAGGEYSSTIHIPCCPFAYGIALASIPICLVFLLEFLKSIRRIVQK